jgi:hypothetical protein
MKTTRPTYTSGSEFDDFLYAPIMEESNGMLLTVLSVLARMNLHPWHEAARLSHLPSESATGALMKLLVALPQGLPEGLDANALARQLIALLPRRGEAPVPMAYPPNVGGFVPDRRAVPTLLWVYLVLTVIFLGAKWLIEPSQDIPNPGVESSAINAIPSSPPKNSLPAGGPTHRD